jgi:N-acetylglucosaminyl-diphospho-decaprenol L-rhamnosyltransferase
VIVNFNGGTEVLDALRSTGNAPAVVADNASTDGSTERIASEFPNVLLVHNSKNIGFGPAVNGAVKHVTTPYVLLLNPDAELKDDALAVLEAAIDRLPLAAAVGPLVRNPDGSVQPSKRAFPTLWQSVLHGLVGLFWPGNPGTRAYTLSDIALDAPRRVDWVSGSAMLLRREFFDAIGGFDERFFFFVSEVDLCRRFADAGYEVWFEPRAEVVHAWGSSWTKRPLKFLWLHHRELFRYATKHRRGLWVLAYPLIGAGLAARFVLLALRWLITRRARPAHTGGT